MRSAAELENELRAIIAEIGRLEKVWDANRAITHNDYNHFKYAKERNEENRQRADRREAASAEIRRLEGVAAGLRREHARARDAELAPKPVEAPSKTTAQMAQVTQNIRDGQAAIEDLHARQREVVVSAAAGDKAAGKKLEELKIAEMRAVNAIDVGLDAIEVLEDRRAEELREFAERDADSKFAAAQAVVGQMLDWSAETQRLLNELAAHFGKSPALQIALMKSGADVNTAITGSIFSRASNNRAAKAAGLQAIFDIDTTVKAVPLDEAFRSALKVAVRRPNPKEKAA
ncbi:hypothetical protein [Bradyrhizobium sp. USDA 4473]